MPAEPICRHCCYSLIKMKLISETKALERLTELRTKFAAVIQNGYEHKAKPCSACETPGACCKDEHFVNVRISRLEARAIDSALAKLPTGSLENVNERVETAVEKYGLHESEEAALKTYACPLYERGLGCLVHYTAKPLPCIAHACYERREDLPPDELLAETEAEIELLNRRTYGKSGPLLPIPVWLWRSDKNNL